MHLSFLISTSNSDITSVLTFDRATWHFFRPYKVFINEKDLVGLIGARLGKEPSKINVNKAKKKNNNKQTLISYRLIYVLMESHEMSLIKVQEHKVLCKICYFWFWNEF